MSGLVVAFGRLVVAADRVVAGKPGKANQYRRLAIEPRQPHMTRPEKQWRSQKRHIVQTHNRHACGWGEVHSRIPHRSTHRVVCTPGVARRQALLKPDSDKGEITCAHTEPSSSP
jgi:hypothetical protein